MTEPKPGRLKLTEVRPQAFANVLYAVAAAAILLDVTTDRLDRWTPNIATTAVALALTLTFVEQIIQRENRRAIQPRIDRALGVLALELKKLSLACVPDYGVRHPTADLQNIWSDDPLMVLQRWQETYEPTTNPRIPRLLLRHCEEFVGKVETIVETNRDVLPPDVVIAADNVSQSFGGAGPSFDEHLEQVAGSTGGEDWLGLVVVNSARALGEVLRRHDAI